MAEHLLTLKVYLEDTDAQGIVYHANYLKYFERARSEILMARGMSPAAFGEQRLRLVVHEAHLKFKRPASFGDTLEVRTTVARSSAYRLTYHHAVHRRGDDQPLTSGTVEIVCIDPEGNLVEVPDLEEI